MIAENNIIPSWNLVYSIGNSIFNAIPPNYKIEELEDPIIIEFTALENINVWDYILIDQKDLTAKKWFWEIWNKLPVMCYISIAKNSKVQYIHEFMTNKHWFKII